MKICFLTDDPSKLGGGPEHIRQVTKILQTKYGLTIDVITPLTMDQNFDLNVFWQRVRFALWVSQFILLSNYDIYHSHSFSTTAFLPVANLFGKIVGVTIHGSGKDIVGGGVINKTFIPSFLRWLALHVWHYDFRLSTSKLKDFKVIGNGVSVEEFSHIQKKTHPGFTVLCIARRDPVKGIEILEKAIHKIKNIKLNLVFDRHWTLSDFAAAEVYVIPSLSEGLPIVLLEAMAAKLPIIATDVGDCREIIEKANCGLVIKPGSVSELVAGIKKMMTDKNRAKMGERGRQYVKENYTWEKVAAGYYSAYSRVNSLI